MAFGLNPESDFLGVVDRICNIENLLFVYEEFYVQEGIADLEYSKCDEQLKEQAVRYLNRSNAYHSLICAAFEMIKETKKDIDSVINRYADKLSELNDIK